MSYIVLHLTSPAMQDGRGLLRGKHEVHNAQYLMRGNNRHKIKTYTGSIDGIYGPGTASATKRCKYWLGYPQSQIYGTFGAAVYSYLVPKSNPAYKPLPADYQKRRAARIKAAAQPPKVKALALARQQVGKAYPWGHEYPAYSNSCTYSQWWGYRGAWCLMFCDYWLSQVGRTLGFSRNDGTAYVPELVNRARYGHYGLSLTSTPAPGDLITFHTRYGADQHVGFFIGWGANSTVVTCDGNTVGGANFADGGYVLVQQRSRSIISHMVKIH